MNGVKKSLVKAKVSAVKTSRKLQASNKEEVEDLLDQTANGQPSTPVGKAVVANAANGTSKPMKKLKSLVNVTERKSERLKQKREASSSSNGDKMEVVEVATEATETNGTTNGPPLIFVTKT